MIKAQGGLEGYAHSAEIITEKDSTRADVHNARYIRKARRFRNEAHVREVLALLPRYGERVLFHSLLEGSVERGYLRLAVWNLIDDGILVPEIDNYILDRSWLRVISAETGLAQ